MDIYNYHPVTGEYLGQSVADPNPEEPGNFLIPAFATKAQPPKTIEREIAVFVDNKWVKQSDNRGVRYWLPDGTEHGITEIGEKPPAGASLTAPQPAITECRASLLAAIAAKRLEIETAGITLSDGSRIGTDRADQAIITSAVSAVALGVTDFDWKTPDGSWIKMSAEQIQQIGALVAQHVQACFTAERQHCEAIAKLPASKLEKYNINTGWPI